MSTSADATRVETATIAFRGPDAASFLQGQLSADMLKLAPGACTLAGLHNPQGRVIALLDVSRISPEEFIATLPRELANAVATRLRKYVLRAKVRVEEPPGDQDGASAAQVLEQVRAGIPQVHAATSEAFVAQMLNLDLLGAIAFDKGCYTGQEVIARAHYRGRVKRRMQRWLNASDVILKPGDAARSPDGRALQVVRGAPVEAAPRIPPCRRSAAPCPCRTSWKGRCRVRKVGRSPSPHFPHPAPFNAGRRTPAPARIPRLARA
jgi:folate-binding protein YgfZ